MLTKLGMGKTLSINQMPSIIRDIPFMPCFFLLLRFRAHSTMLIYIYLSRRNRRQSMFNQLKIFKSNRKTNCLQLAVYVTNDKSKKKNRKPFSRHFYRPQDFCSKCIDLMDITETISFHAFESSHFPKNP